jgi:hypothetical protein
VSDQVPLPKSHQTYWERPPFKDQGNEKPEPIWQAIGSSLTTWEMVENTFAHIFRYFVDSNSEAASRAYGAIQSHRGRSDALMEAAEVYFAAHALHVSEERWDEFKLLMAHFGKAAGRRNEIAHGVTLWHPEAGNFLVPPAYNSRKTQAFPVGSWLDKFTALRVDYRFTAEDISLITSKFHHLHSAAIQFLAKIAEIHRKVEKQRHEPQVQWDDET